MQAFSRRDFLLACLTTAFAHDLKYETKYSPVCGALLLQSVATSGVEKLLATCVVDAMVLFPPTTTCAMGRGADAIAEEYERTGVAPFTVWRGRHKPSAAVSAAA